MLNSEEVLNMQKFSLKLHSRSDVKRNQEALEQLKNLYPFEIDDNKIVIKPTEEKGLYDVYISKTEIVHEKDFKRLLITCLLVFFACLICILLICHRIHLNKEDLLQQKQIEAQKIEQENRKKENEIKLINLENQYKELISQEYEKIYPRIECIYSVMSKGSVIESILIDKLMFTVEVTTKDALGILKAFENSSLFGNVKMNRTTVKNNQEYVVYSGEFSSIIKQPESNLTVDEKISFFEKEIGLLKDKRKKQETRQLSDYINQIRKYLHVNGCNEQYIQLHSIDKISDIEFFIFSTSKGILSFLEQIQNDEDNFFDIKQLSIRNSEDRNKIQTTVCFKSWIHESESPILNNSIVNKNISVSEIDSLFYKKPSVSTTVRTVLPSRSMKNENVKLKTLTYVGMSKLNGDILIVVKDDTMGAIYKLPLCNSEINSNCCFEINGVYKAKIRNVYYEVKK